jgi:phosphonate transport system substrate-binding protein
MRSNIWCTAAVVLGVAGAAALPLAQTAGAAEDCEDPNELTFSIIPTEDTAHELELYQPIINHLSEKTGKKIDFYAPTSYTSVVEAQAAGWVDVAVHGPNSYVLATEMNDEIRVFATYARQKGHMQEEGPGYKAALISKADSGIESIEDAEGTLLGLVDPASTSGNLLPEVAFSEVIGMELREYFDDVVYTGGHDLSTIAVKEGRVDVAFVATHRFDNVVERGDITLDDVNVLWMSRVVPQDPFTYRMSLCEDLRKNIRSAFLSAHEVEDAKPFFEAVNSSRFVEMSDEDYDIIRPLRAASD